MKKLGLIAFAALLSASAFAQDMASRMMKFYLGVDGGTTVSLWQDRKAPHDNGVDYANLPANSYEMKPEFEIFLPKSKEPTRAVIICPGGGYVALAALHEGAQWRNFFASKNMAVVVLKYRMPHGVHQVPAEDVYETLRYLKAHAAELNILPNQIGIMGSSAGGHLASTVATKAPADLRPAFQILFYPVITMEQGVTHQGSRENLLGKQPSDELVRLYSNELQVKADTPPAFIVLAADDDVVPVANGLRYYQALADKKVPSELHCYPSGGHGFGILDSFKNQTQLKLELSIWLDSLK